MESLERTKPQITEYKRFHLAARLVARCFDAAVASLPRSPSTEKTNGVNVRRFGNAKFTIFGFLLFFMTEEDFGWISIPISWLVSISDTNVEDSSLTAGPKTMYCEITT
jgi:hypothetical protein